MPILYNEDDLSGKFSKTIYAGHINSLGLVSGIFSSHWQLASIYICYTAGNEYIAQTWKKSQTFFKNLVVVYIAKYPKCFVWCGTKYIHYYFHVVVSRFPHSLKKVVTGSHVAPHFFQVWSSSPLYGHFTGEEDLFTYLLANTPPFFLINSLFILIFTWS